MNESNHEESAARAAAAGGGRPPGRRRFLQGAAGTGLVAITMVGRPAWAGRCTLSGQMSGNLSVQDEEPCWGEGLSPGFWKIHRQEWHPEFPPYMAFATAFGVNAFPGMTLFDVISLEEDPKLGQPENILRALGFQSVAALQNAATPVRYDLTVSEVQATFRYAYLSGSKRQMEAAKDSLDELNNQGSTAFA